MIFHRQNIKSSLGIWIFKALSIDMTDGPFGRETNEKYNLLSKLQHKYDY